MSSWPTWLIVSCGLPRVATTAWFWPMLRSGAASSTPTPNHMASAAPPSNCFQCQSRSLQLATECLKGYELSLPRNQIAKRVPACALAPGDLIAILNAMSNVNDRRSITYSFVDEGTIKNSPDPSQRGRCSVAQRQTNLPGCLCLQPVPPSSCSSRSSLLSLRIPKTKRLELCHLAPPSIPACVETSARPKLQYRLSPFGPLGTSRPALL